MDTLIDFADELYGSQRSVKMKTKRPVYDYENA